MAISISLDVVSQQFAEFSTHSLNAAKYMSNVVNNYIEGTNSEWNTPSAGKFIDQVCSAFGDFAEQYNKMYQEEVDKFTEGVNQLARTQDAQEVTAPTVEPLKNFARTWQDQSTNFNIPEDYASFTTENLTNNLAAFNEELASMQGCIDAIVSNGLSEATCTGLRESLRTLQSSAVSVAERYDSKFAQDAVNEDSLVAAYKQN